MSLALPPERLILLARFVAVCATHPQWDTIDPTTQQAITRRMERSCFAHTIDVCVVDGVNRMFTERIFVHRYSETCSRVLSNISMHARVLDRIISGECDPLSVAGMSSAELYPEANAIERLEIRARQELKVSQKVSRSYYCGQCGANETTLDRRQTRGSDEDDTLFIQCVACKHSWKRS